MKVELQCGDTIAIPDGCKAIVKDGSVVFEKEFEDGDVLCSAYSGTMVIFKEKEKDGSRYFYSHYNTDRSSNKGWNSAAFRHATEEEKKQLFDKMKEQDLRWNAEEKRVEKLLWRADAGEEYYFINSSLKVIKIEECWSVLCSEHYSANNYFRTKEQAEEAAKRVKETLRNYHEEIGE
ncbi:hypothetical protein [Prevotella pallens]|jgi:hypothetical protein|uniref:hypothetical protein n=1 Tax=Prevotella pallens TaxID=60133 RepID=UPI001CB572D7|nr:hypothetical protein [Prevotella pallens]MBF1517372.1 hypothetical protein [Prevotella pallens]